MDTIINDIDDEIGFQYQDEMRLAIMKLLTIIV